MADDENKTAHAHAEPEEKPDLASGEESMEKSEDEEAGQGEEQQQNTKEEDGEDESDEESDAKEELPPGLLEQPLEVQGKREKKKVERLSATMARVPEKKKVEIEEGSGVKLSEVPFIENQVNTTKAIDLKPFHRLLFLRIGTQLEVKRNIRQFCGFTHAKDSKEYERRVTMLSKMVLTELKSITSVLGLERKGTKQEIIDRIMDFLIKPKDLGLKIGEKKGKRGRKSGTKSKVVVKRKRSSKKTETKKLKSKPKAKSKSKKEDDDDDDDDEGGDDDEDAVSEEEEGDEDGEEVEEEEEEESEDEAPKKKKRKVEPKKKSPKVSKVNGKKEKSPKKETKKVTKKETKKAPKKSASPKKKVADDISDSLSDDSDSSEDECVANLKKKMPPSNDTIKELVKKILDGADLETVTMKTVVKQVYSEYPSFDLSDRKDFIKDSVREIIS